MTRILEAAHAQFESIGVRHSSMDDVARRSRLGRATVYRRFANKYLLVVAVVLSEALRYFAGHEQARNRGTTIAERKAESMVYIVRFLREHTLLNRLMETEPAALLPHLTYEGGALIELMRRQSSAVLLAELYPGATPNSPAGTWSHQR